MRLRTIAIAATLVGLVSAGAWGLSVRRSSGHVWTVLSVTKQDNGNDAVSIYAGAPDGVLELQASAKRIDVKHSLPRCVDISLDGDVHVTDMKSLGSAESLPPDWLTDPDRRMDVTILENGEVSIRFMRN